MLGRKIQQLCSSAIYKQNVSISLHLSDSVYVGEVSNFEDGRYISGLEHCRKIKCSKHVHQTHI